MDAPVDEPPESDGAVEDQSGASAEIARSRPTSIGIAGLGAVASAVALTLAPEAAVVVAAAAGIADLAVAYAARRRGDRREWATTAADDAWAFAKGDGV